MNALAEADGIAKEISIVGDGCYGADS